MKSIFTLVFALAFAFAAFAQDTQTGSYTMHIAPAALVLNPAGGALPGLQIGVAYNASIAISGGVAPYVAKLTSGALPAGITFTVSNASVVFSGTPTALCTPDPCSFVLTVTDSAPIAQNVKFTTLGSLVVAGEARATTYTTINAK